MSSMNILIGLAFAAIIGALLFAGISMVRRPQDGEKKRKTMMHALAVRVGLSIALFGCIWLAHWAGWIQPTGLPTH